MKRRIKDKVNELDRYLGEFAEIKPQTLEEYLEDFKTRAACERYAEVIIESIIDLAFLVVKYKGLKQPDNDLHVFDILAQNKIISDVLARKLQDAKRMRNILAHEYGTVDNEIVFNAIKEEIEIDTTEFLESITKLM